jgi:pimeloyl-ACP methyl ester carboxylesterase
MSSTRGELFKFTNARGQTIKGVIFGKGGARGVGVVYLPGIVLGCTAVHRIGIELAHELANDGYPVCLFDPSGVGESDGDYPAGTHQEVAAWVEDGHFVDDTLAAVEFLKQRSEFRHMVLVGHCGGALTGIYAAAQHPQVRGTVLICPPTTEARRGDELERDGVSAIYLRQYLHKLTSREAWLHLLRGGSSYRTIWRVVTGQVASQLRRLRSRKPIEPRARPFNERLRQALDVAYASGRQITIVFGDRDPGVEDFRAFVREHVPDGVDVRILANTSHGFVTEDSMEMLFTVVRRRLDALESAR